MGRVDWRPGNMLYPVPAVLVTVADKEGRPNVFTVAWTGTVCSNPPMVSISVRPQRYSYHCIEETGEFVINLTTKKLAFATDYCGVKSGRDVDKFKEMHLTALPAKEVKAPLIAQSPVSLECRVKQTIPLGSHTMFVAEIVSVSIDDAYLDEENKFHLDWADPIVYSHGTYYDLGKALGTFGYSVAKKKNKNNEKK
ncbi:MAG: flavin reductase family protein [Eubacteriales bacterium]|nr:flavin reductase family protein [Eubacteriales bacterium]